MSARLKIAFICLMAVACFFCFRHLTESPPLWYDEGIYDQIAMNSALGLGHVIQVAPHEYVSAAFVTGGYPFIKPVAWSLRVFGMNVLATRLVMVVFILALLLALTWLISRVYGWRSAVVSLALLVTFPVLYGNGKSVLGEIPGLLYLSLFLLSIYRIETKGYERILPYMSAGLFGGLCLSTKPIFFLLGGAVIVAVILKRKSITFRLRPLAYGLALFIIPMTAWFLQQFMVTDSASRILTYYANPYGIANVPAQIMSNFLRFFHESSPIYFALLMLVWLAAMIVRRRLGRSVSLVETIAITFALLVTGAYLRTAGWYRYFFVAEILALAFLPAAIGSVASYFGSFWPRIQKRLKLAVPIIFVVLMAIQTYQLLVTSWVAVHDHNTSSQDLAEYFENLPANQRVYIYNVPEVALFIPGQRYSQYLAPTETLTFGGDTLAEIKGGHPALLITSGTHMQELAARAPLYTATSTVAGYVIFKHRP